MGYPKMLTAWEGDLLRYLNGDAVRLDFRGAQIPERLREILECWHGPTRHVPGCALGDHRVYGMPGDEPACSCVPAARVVVELDVDRVKDQIRDAVVELVDERDRARATSTLLEQQLAATRRLLDEALDFGHGARTLAEIRVDLEVLDGVTVAMCACPDAVVDGHVCEVS